MVPKASKSSKSTGQKRPQKTKADEAALVLIRNCKAVEAPVQVMMYPQTHLHYHKMKRNNEIFVAKVGLNGEDTWVVRFVFLFLSFLF